MDHKKNQPGREKARHPSLRPVSKPDDAADGGISRREFLGVAAASILLTHAEQQSPRRESGNGIPYRTLGRSGEKVSLIGLGGYHLGNQADPQERSEEHTSELQSRENLVCRLLLEKKKKDPTTARIQLRRQPRPNSRTVA